MEYKYFSELKHPEKMSPDFMRSLIEFREFLGFPFPVTSSYRDPKDNKRVGGSKKSMHMQGRAVDILVSGRNAAIMLDEAISFGFTGIGLRQHGDWDRRFIHIDDREGPLTVWTYDA